MVNARIAAKKNNGILPLWLLKLIGITSIATTVIGFAIYWFKKYPPRRRIERDANRETHSEVILLA